MAGLLKGKSHKEGGIKKKVRGSTVWIEVEGGEFHIPNQLFSDTHIYTYTGSNLAILRKLIKDHYFRAYRAHQRLVKKNEIEAGDYIICKASLSDNTEHSYMGTLAEIVHSVNASSGHCKVDEPQAQVKYSKGSYILPPGMKIQSVIVQKEKFNKIQAGAWVKKHKFVFNLRVMDETDNYYRFRQLSPRKFNPSTFKTIVLRPGVKAVVGMPVQKMQPGGEINSEITTNELIQIVKENYKKYNSDFSKSKIGEIIEVSPLLIYPRHTDKTLREGTDEWSNIDKDYIPAYNMIEVSVNNNGELVLHDGHHRLKRDINKESVLVKVVGFINTYKMQPGGEVGIRNKETGEVFAFRGDNGMDISYKSIILGQNTVSSIGLNAETESDWYLATSLIGIFANSGGDLSTYKRIKKVRLIIKNPFVVDNLDELVQTMMDDVIEIKGIVKDKYSIFEDLELNKSLINELVLYWKNSGYDGIIIKNDEEFGGKTFIVFDASQITDTMQPGGEVLTGGKADNMTLQNLADKHNVPISELRKEYIKGLAVEHEHTDNPNIAAEITKDHLFESPIYYSELAKMEKKFDKGVTVQVDNKARELMAVINNCYLANPLVKQGFYAYSDNVLIIAFNENSNHNETYQKAVKPNLSQYFEGNIKKAVQDCYDNGLYQKYDENKVKDILFSHPFLIVASQNKVYFPFESYKDGGGVETNNNKTMEYVYILRSRPFSIGTHPTENFIRYEEGFENSLYGAVIYTKELTYEQVKNYELQPYTFAQNVVGKSFYKKFGTGYLKFSPIGIQLKNQKNVLIETIILIDRNDGKGEVSPHGATQKENYNSADFLKNVTNGEWSVNIPQKENKAQEMKVENISDAEIIETYKPINEKQRKEVNEKINELIEKYKKSKDAETKLILEKYEGKGSSKTIKDADIGLLSQFYTPYIICKKMWDLINHYYPYEIKNVLEPSLGTGRMFKFAPETAKLYGFEPDQINSNIAKVLYPEAKIQTDVFETAFMDKDNPNKSIRNTESWLPKMDVVIGNPPYGKYSGYYKTYMPKAFSMTEILFIYLGLKTLKQGGILCYCIGQNFLNNGNTYNEMKTHILKIADFVDAVRLPGGIFSFTDIGTDIIIFKKK